MKKTLLSLGLLGLALSGQAQYLPRWETINPLTTSETPPGTGVASIHTMTPTTMWATAYDGSGTTAGPTDSYIRTNSAVAPAGVNLVYGPVARRSDPGFQTSNIFGLSEQVALASTFAPSGPGGEILRTVDGGANWARVTTAANFAAPDGFNNLVHMFPDGLHGVSFGDANPNTGIGSPYEVLLTSDGGLTWTRNTNSGLATIADPGEYGLTRSFHGRGNTIWIGAGQQAPPTGGPGGNSRMFRSTDFGLTWQTATVPFAGPPVDITFKSDSEGLCMNTESNGTNITRVNLARTTDGGLTWTSVTPTGRLYYFGLDAAQGKFISFGRFLNGTTNLLADRGYSYSTDGINWIDVQTQCQFISMDVLDANAQGYGGMFTTNTDGDGGVFKTLLPGGALDGVVTGTRNNSAAVQKALSVYPNPSNSGIFTVQLNSGLKANTAVRVTDALGRTVYNRTLNSASSVNTSAVMLDLSAQKAGLYTLEVRTAEGTAQQKLVIE
ncbi:T9SS type A sorting domain-containing protein [Hymenobacter sp. ASUV-10]|uniref:T9SS type A sorting domain-containing protein n=1 Tax=Hymenobacter aranciens TaxID=3063996 RepID=A0ABT9B6Y8_9BACT|nr:T9SS type A sorting domain-containing protein [Hymenobacter sp. ASUV-10]MDO7873980.1 T9SS type A sorting domain-containing protein [Hymenobacter sp. ASUV-10]